MAKKVECPTCGGTGKLDAGAVAFAARLRQLRGDRTQEDFAKSMGTTRNMLANLENGRHQPRMPVLLDIADKCGVTTDWLLGRS